MRLPRWIPALAALLAGAGADWSVRWTFAQDVGIEFFEKRVRPALSEHCLKCHATDVKGGPKGGLALDSRPALRKGGDSGPAVEPGKPDDSLLIQALAYTDEALKMPPKGKLPDSVIADFRRWVEMGAPDPRVAAAPASSAKRVINIEEGRKFWSFQPLSRPEPPSVKMESWAINDIDRFIMAKQEPLGLHPNPLADRAKLIRRVYLDLLGIPPTPDEVDAFVKDADPSAYDRLIDRLLANPHYGERWGRHWLDLARFGESSGYEHDNDRPHSYQYRDFVIEALNRDMPFDQFVRWQIAGDLLAPDQPLALKATGFLAIGAMNGQITERTVEKERYDVLDDWIGVIGTSMLGVTIGCARCHDHKYDPIPVQDYYRFASTFTKTVRLNAAIGPDPATTGQALADFERTHRPLVEAADEHERKTLVRTFEEWLKAGAPAPQSPSGVWLTLDLKAPAQDDLKLERRRDGAMLVVEANNVIGSYVVEAETSLKTVTAIRLEAMIDPSLPNAGPGLGDQGNFNVSGLQVSVAPLSDQEKSAKPITAKLIEPKTDSPDKGAAGPGTFRVGAAESGRNRAVMYKLDPPVGFEKGSKLQFRFNFPGDSPAGRQALGCFRISVAVGSPIADLNAPEMPEPRCATARAALAKPPAQRTADDKQALFQLFARNDPEWRKRDDAVRRSEQSRPRAYPQSAFMVREASGHVPMRMMIQGPDYYQKTHLLKRGDPEQKLEEVQPGYLQALTRDSASSAPKNRADLAIWLTDVDRGAGPVAARVIVNRLWQHHFGRGIVATPSDFGVQGERPSHPELLDWLASELVRHQWSLKSIHRLILRSAAYRQSAVSDEARAKIDPENLYLWKRSLQRLEAEAIRDSMLSVSGRLDLSMFGPGTLDENMTRRSVYFTVKRSRLVPFLVQLDWPDALQGLGRRPSTTVAPQALLLLNGPQVRASAEAFARRLRPNPQATLEQAAASGFRHALGRAPSPEELQASLEFLKTQAQSYASLPAESDREAAALTDFCQTLFGLNEFVYAP